MTTILGIICVCLLGVISFVALYQWLHAIVAMLTQRRPQEQQVDRRTKFLILIPAHNEEDGLPATLRSLSQLRYPKALVRIVVIADRCADATAKVAREGGALCLERNDGPGGKGAAMSWAMQQLRAAGEEFDALVIVDADCVADANLLIAFDDALAKGQQVQQGYNYLSNPWETPFTRVIAVTSVLRNFLFYGGKEALGWSAMLSGTGMCLSRQIVDQHGWSAFSVAEDWEFSVSLLLNNVRIHFNPWARVFATESKGLKQASRQRLRWATGRYAVMTHGAKRLLLRGISERRPDFVDGAITLAAPNYSSQASLTVFSAVCSLLVSQVEGWGFLMPWSLVVLASLGGYFLLGAFQTESPLKTLAGIPYIAVFLPWRLGIEILGMLGFGRKGWGRTFRDSASRKS
ncbi:MAG: glycosyltransferase family 2 protein [Nitrospiraceae bacterium]|nr:glycosyltransferase family 2 protein [Nitrospiraceae bacterium]